ncbi:hypothetical protein CAOG_06376 [Capsaspora owczarzaki ATCC 30864]|uniref:Myotubularin phosphatase domain-containing protein n=1 Tax=Capsaspora owczarzaki (strain ATCC 30864) TaxID=595528 RepID=A0A0D2WTV9_CAPO3|nr:hypothetical protein CAOG_06376 [Capsaspora owczarzaki ATCC 30864]KJE96000.1 hypothetical protein CAOG_006376 [Capsaspora owczarzaki ATCC 30864]|eukprot:XP_004345125.2 hypothetical protein CAOG_06376 [Capsaspora owczarzaki ATCC 30864]
MSQPQQQQQQQQLQLFGTFPADLCKVNQRVPGLVSLNAHHLVFVGRNTTASEDVIIPAMNVNQVQRKTASALFGSSAGAALLSTSAATSSSSSLSSSLSPSSSLLSSSPSTGVSASGGSASSAPGSAANIPGIGSGSAGSASDSLVLVIRCTDFRDVVLRMTSEADCNAVASWLSRAAFPDSVDKLFPFARTPPSFPEFNGWNLYNPQEEYQRMGIPSALWRLSSVNSLYKSCEGYPRLLCVPADIDDKILGDSFKAHLDYAAPVLAYHHPATKAVLVRTGLPMPAPGTPSVQADNKLMDAILRTNPHKRACVIDTRSPSAASAYKKKYPSAHGSHYPSYARYFVGLEGFQALRESMARLIDYAHDTSISASSWVSRLESSGWLRHVRAMMVAAASIARLIGSDATSVVLASQEIFDVGNCAVALAMLLMDPYFRTVQGFQVLIEKEWLSFGHRFSDRHGHYGPPGNRYRAAAPVFTLFLDCVWQITQQFPASFQFGESYLRFLRDHSYCSPYGTFLMNSEAERTAARLQLCTQSLWSFLSEPEHLHPLTNPLYLSPAMDVLLPACRPQNTRFWANLYCRYVFSWEGPNRGNAKLQSLREDTARCQLAADTAEGMAAEMEQQLEKLSHSHDALFAELEQAFPNVAAEWNKQQAQVDGVVAP